MKVTRRLLCLLLALAMVMTLAPAVALAEEVTEEAETDRIEATVPAEEPDEKIPETGPVTVEIPFRVNPLYEGMITAADLDIPEFPEKDPDQVQPNAITYQTIANAGKELRKQLKNRAETFTIYVKSENSNAQAVSDEIFGIAMEHTGVATEGDYIAWQLGGYGGQASRSWNSTTQMYEFTLELVVPYYTTAAQEQEMNTAVTSLINTLGIRYKSHYDKIYAVYDWLCKNVTYDYANLEDNTYLLKHTAYAALIDRTAVCQGYAVLFYRLMLELGVDARVIVGDGGGPHAWNIVKLNNLYYNLDSTWDAGQSEYIWFLNNTWDFVGHEREMDYDTIAFHNEYPMAADSYEPGKTATKDPYISAGYCGTADNDHANAQWWLGRDGTLTIKGTGSTYDFNTSDEQPYYTYWIDDITKVVVEDGITGLGKYNFYDFPELKEVVLPASVKTLGDSTFNRCDKLETVKAPGLESIGGHVFGYCSALKNFTFPDSLKSIGAYAFADCDSLTTLAFPNGLEVIEKYAFEDCGGITSVSLPNTLTTIGYAAFQGCGGIKSITIPASLVNVDKDAFFGCSALETVTFSNGVTAVPQNMFRSCGKLKTVNLPASVTEIGASAFEACTSLTGITLPQSLRNIGSRAFAYCGLTSITIPDSVTTIGDGAFAGNPSMKTMKLPANLNAISNNLFANCPLTSITIPSSVTEIGNMAFCGAEITSLTIPEGVTRIGDDAFAGCVKLTKLTLPQSLTYFSGFARCTGLKSIDLPDSVTEIGISACQENTSLTSITIPDSVTKIGAYAFNGCTALTTLDLPENLTEIPQYMANRTALTSLVIPDKVTTIGEHAFQECTDLKTITFSQGLTTIESYAFTDCTALTEVIIPASLEKTKDNAFANCTALKKVTVNGRLWFDVFRNCTALETVVLKDTVTAIGGSAFDGCISLKEITVPATCENISSEAFANCTALEKAVLCGDIGFRAFDNCTSLKDVELLEGTTMIGSSCFRNCNALTSLVIPRSTEKIATEPFKGCFNLREIKFIGDAPELTYSVFQDVTATVYYPAGNATWTADVMKQYEGNVTWEPYGVVCTEHSYEAVVTEPTCSEQGYTTYTCTVCGYSYVDNYTDPVDHSYEDGHCKWCGKVNSTVKWSTISTSLGGNIAMNFYVELSEDLISDPNAYIQFTFAGRALTFPLSTGVPTLKNGVTVYQFACPITSKNMTDEITAQVYNATGKVGEPKTMSVDTYCNWVIANFKDEKTVNLMKGMLNYGASAQLLFKYRTDDLANASLAEEDKVFGAVDASAYKHSVVGTEEGIIAKSMTLLLDSETTVRVYFELTGDKTIDQYTFTVDGVEVQPTYKDGKYYVERPNISAHKLDDMHVFTCGGITVTYGGLSYVNQVMTYYTSGTTFDMASALYAYAKAAEAYIN